MMSLQKIEKIVMYKSNLSYPFGYHNANKAQKIHQILTKYQQYHKYNILNKIGLNYNNL